jgi:hypothetical protein
MKFLKNFLTFSFPYFLGIFCADSLFWPDKPLSFNLTTALLSGGIYGIVTAIMRSKKEVIASLSSNSIPETKQAWTEFRKEFSLSSSRGQFAILLLISLSIFALLFIWLDNDLILSKKVPFSIFLIASLLSCLLSFKRSRLILTQQGIGFRGFGITVTGAWDTVKEVFKSRNGNEVLILKTATCITIFGTRNVTDFEIPLSDFEDAWQTGEIGRLLKENAPHLQFVEHKEPELLEIDSIEENEYWKAIRRVNKGNK